MPDFGHLKKIIVAADQRAPYAMPEITYPGQPEGTVPTLFVVTTGEKNAEYTRLVASVSLQQAKQRVTVTADEMLRRVKERRARFRKLAPTLIVKGWEHVYARDPATGAPALVPYTIENCVELFFPEDHVDASGKPTPGVSDETVDRLVAFCADETNFTAANPEVTAKN